MPADVPYMNSVKNVPAILDRIQVAGTPPRFTHDFLASTLGFSSSSDRGILKVLKALGFLSGDGTPTRRYNQFRGEGASSKAMAAGLREGWSDVLLADGKAYNRTYAEQTEIFKNVTGKGEAVAQKMASTFRALADRADWSEPETSDIVTPEEPSEASDETPAVEERGDGGAPALSLHHDIHIHLPPSADVAVYTAIFRALREELRD